MKKIIYLQIVILSLNFFSCREENLTDTQKIDQKLKKWNDTDNPGFVVSVSKNDSLIYSKGFGLANLELGEKNTTQTVFNIGSITKSITAACVVKLVHDHRIELSDSLGSIFPELHPEIGNATIKQLLNHTSGIRDNESFGQLVESKGTDPNTGFFIGDDKDHIQLLNVQKTLNFTHGSKYMYNNTGYWLLGQIVEKISGLPIEEFAKKQIFKPLEMNNSSYGIQDIQNTAIGYHQFNPEERPSLINITSKSYGDGGVYSSTEDLVKWFNEIVTGKKFGPDFWKEIKTNGLLNDGTKTEYGAGLEIKNKNGEVTYSHGGLVPGYFAMGKFYSKSGITISVLTNQTQIDAGQIVSLIEDAVLPKDKAPEVITLSEVESKKYTGKFQQTTGSEIGLIRHIIKKGEDFFYHRPESENTQIYPVGSDEFIMPFGNQGADIKIITDKISGKRKLIFKGNDGEPDRIYSEITNDKKLETKTIDLNKFVGTYQSDETQLSWEVKKVEDKLLIDVNTFESQLNWIANTRFTFEGRFSVNFKFNEKNEITSFILDFGKAKNIEFIRL